MPKLESFLEQLVGAGMTLPSVDELGDDARKLFEEMLGADEAAKNYQKEAADAKSKLEEMDARRKGQDTKIREQQELIKSLQEKSVTSSTDTADVSATYKSMLEQQQKAMDEKYGQQLSEVLDILKAQKAENEILAAKVAKNKALADLAEEFPILKDPKYHDLLPSTSDEAVLKERAKKLTELKTETENWSLQQIRDGHIPPTAPPKVIPGKPESLEREIDNINSLRDSGQITVQEASKRLDDVMTAYASG